MNVLYSINEYISLIKKNIDYWSLIGGDLIFEIFLQTGERSAAANWHAVKVELE